MNKRSALMRSLTPDQKSSLAFMGRMFGRRVESQKPLLFVIAGYSGAGKSIFGRVLEQTGNNTLYVDLLPDNHPCEPLPNLSDFPTNNASAVVFDELQFVLPDSICPVVDQLLENGVAVVLLVQTVKELPAALVEKAELLSIDRMKLQPIEARLHTQTFASTH